MSDTIEAGLVRTLKGPIAHDDELGIQYAVTEGGALELRLPWAPHLAEQSDGRRIAPGALAALLDTGCGLGAMAALDFDEAVATLDLRIDYVRQAEEGRDCVATCWPVDVLGRSGNGAVLMRAEARQNDGRLIAYAFGRFIRRPLKEAGGSHSSGAPSAVTSETAVNYADLMRFERGSDGSVVMPYRPGLIGNGSLPSIHGGALAALLQRAAQQAVDDSRSTPMRLSTASFNFLRFGAPADITAKAYIERLGGSVGFVRAWSWQRHGPERHRAVHLCPRRGVWV